MSNPNNRWDWVFDENYMSKLWNHWWREQTFWLLQFNIETKEFDILIEPEFDELVFLDLWIQKEGDSLIHSFWRDTFETDSWDKFLYTRKADKFLIYKISKNGKKELINKDFDITYIYQHIEDKENDIRYIECFWYNKKYTLLYDKKDETFNVSNTNDLDSRDFRFYLNKSKNFDISEFNYNKLLEIFFDELWYFTLWEEDVIFDEKVLEKSEKKESFLEISEIIYNKWDLSNIKNSKLEDYISFLLETQKEGAHTKFYIPNINVANFFNDTFLNNSLEYIIDYISETKKKNDILTLWKYRFIKYTHTPEIISKGVNIYEPMTRYYSLEDSDNKILKGTVIWWRISGGSVDINDNLFIYSEDWEKYSELLFWRVRDSITSADYIFWNLKINHNNDLDLSIFPGYTYNIDTALNLFYEKWKIEWIDKYFDFNNMKLNISFIEKWQYWEINVKDKYVHNPQTNKTQNVEIEIKKDIDWNRLEEDWNLFYWYNDSWRRLYSWVIKDWKYNKLKLNWINVHDILSINTNNCTIKVMQNGNKYISYNPDTYELKKDYLGHLLVKMPKWIEAYCYNFNLQNSWFLSIEWDKDYKFNKDWQRTYKWKIVD
jgi:hypothetical protein